MSRLPGAQWGKARPWSEVTDLFRPDGRNPVAIAQAPIIRRNRDTRPRVVPEQEPQYVHNPSHVSYFSRARLSMFRPGSNWVPIIGLRWSGGRVDAEKDWQCDNMFRRLLEPGRDGVNGCAGPHMFGPRGEPTGRCFWRRNRPAPGLAQGPTPEEG